MRYRVLTSITMNRHEHLPGSEIELTPEQASAMPWAVEAIVETIPVAVETGPPPVETMEPKPKKRGRK